MSDEPSPARRSFHSALWLTAAVVVMGCDRFEAPSPSSSASASTEEPEQKARGSLDEMMKAALAVTESCKAGELVWEADRTDEGTVPRHFSRPCIPEVCLPTGEQVEALRSSVSRVKTAMASDRALDQASIRGLLALGTAMVAFIDTNEAASVSRNDDPSKPRSSISGLSMHYASMATAFRVLYPDAAYPAEPPSLVASLAVAQPGGDVCKGWAQPRYCDVSAVRVPKERRWRADPACIEVEAIAKPDAK